MGTATELVDWALNQIGTTEDPPGSNHVRYWDDIGLHGFQGEPWCAAFYLAGLLATNTVPVTRSVYVPTIRANYQAVRKLHSVSEARPGDQVLYRFGQGHTGVLVSTDVSEKTITTVEGNTSPDNRGSQDNGGGVFLRHRPWAQVWGVGRPDFDPEQSPLSQEADVPAPNDVVDSAICPDGGGWDMHADGGVFAWNGTPRGVPKDYIAVANDGAHYHFDPTLQAKGLISYPALPLKDRQGARYFVRMLVVAP